MSISGSFSCSINLYSYRTVNSTSENMIYLNGTLLLLRTHQSIAFSMPWFPVCATAFSLQNNHCVRESTGSVCKHQCHCSKIITYALFLSKPISSRLSNVVLSAIVLKMSLLKHYNNTLQIHRTFI